MTGQSTQFNREDVDTLLLDMDGTVLDLAFDNFFWLELLPRYLARARGISVTAARDEIRDHTDSVLGSLQWYCIDHWTDRLGIDIAAIKHEVRHRIAYLPGALEFLQRARTAGMRLVIVTNAHQRTLAIKLRQTHLERHVDAVYSSHDFGQPKESAQFWNRFENSTGISRARSLLVDDSQAVVETARNSGLAAVFMIARPDSQRPRRELTATPGVDALADLERLLLP